jgi:hypothetical protein
MEKQYFITKEQYQTVKQTWASTTEHPAWHHIIYNALRSKPTDSGFSEKTNHIQGNDSWYGFNSALKEAQRECSLINPWEAQKGTVHDNMYTRFLPTITTRQKQFKAIFGIDIPEDIMTFLGGTK